jgi:hypothetical protein
MTITARYASTCPNCSRPIAVGSQVNWSRGRKAVHVACGRASTPTRQRVARGRRYVDPIDDDQSVGTYELDGPDRTSWADLQRNESEYQTGLAEGRRYSAERRIYGDALAEQFAMQDEMNRYNAGID